MEGLTLRREVQYTPQQVGLERPLVFTHRRICIEEEWMALTIPVTHQATLDNLEVFAQISPTQCDRAVIPVWMVEGDFTDRDHAGSFFKGILRPSYQKVPDVGILVHPELPVFHYYMEREDIAAEFGVEINAAQMIKGRAIRTVTMRCPDFMGRSDITPNFRVWFIGGTSNLITFRPAGRENRKS